MARVTQFKHINFKAGEIHRIQDVSGNQTDILCLGLSVNPLKSKIEFFIVSKIEGFDIEPNAFGNICTFNQLHICSWNNIKEYLSDNE